MRYWLFKSEPSEFSIEDLRKAKKQTEHWDGVRNYQARNLLRDDMKAGDFLPQLHESHCRGGHGNHHAGGLSRPHGL